MADNIEERWIEVNDNDLSNPNLTYSGDWFVDSYEKPLDPPRRAVGGLTDGTAHGTNTVGGLSLEFMGRAVNIWGQSSTVPPATPEPISCTINGTPGMRDNLTSTYRPGRIWRLCYSDDLYEKGPGPHRVVLNITSNSDVIYWVDYINYYSTLNPDLKGKKSRIVSASDSMRFVGYGWDNVTTTRRSYIGGDVIRTTFYGTSVEMRGYQDPWFPQSPGIASYSIDGGTPVTFTLHPYPFEFRGLSPDQALTRVSIFKTQPVDLGNHTIEVVNIGNISVVPLTFESFLVTDEAATSPLVSSSSTTKSSATSTNLGGPPATSSPSSPKEDLVPVIAGAVGGAIVILLCGALVIYCLWRKRKRAKEVPGGPPGQEATEARFRTQGRNMAIQPYYAVPLEEPPPFSDCPSYSDSPDDSSPFPDPNTSQSFGSTPPDSESWQLPRQTPTTRSPPSFSAFGTPPIPPQTSRRRLPPPLPPSRSTDDPPSPESPPPAPVTQIPPILPMHNPHLVERPAIRSADQARPERPAQSRPAPPLPTTKPRLAPGVRPAVPGRPRTGVPEPDAVVGVSPGVSPPLAPSQSMKRRLPPPPPVPQSNPSAPDHTRRPSVAAAPVSPQPHRRAVPPPVARRLPPDPSVTLRAV